VLTQLSIKNYALIDDLNVSFEKGFTTITGETGAGKSILLGGLSSVLGKRADLASLKDDTKKCIIEATFSLKNYDLIGFFADNDLDYEPTTILRREILPSGKSRAFINDTPVNLNALAALGAQLVDVHSQHQTLELTENAFQFRVIDALAENTPFLQKYRGALTAYRNEMKELEDLIEMQTNVTKELDYNSFLLQELEKADLKPDMLELLEEEHEQLSNVEHIMSLLAETDQLLQDEQMGILAQMSVLLQASQKLQGFGKQYLEMNERLQSISIELIDVGGEIDSLKDRVEADPQRLSKVSGQLQLLHDLLTKHQKSTISELLAIQNELSEKVNTANDIETVIAKKQQQIDEKRTELENLSAQIRQRRQKEIPKLNSFLEKRMATLGMAAARFNIDIQPATEFKTNGKDELSFLFSANKGSSFGELKKVASGGELSRIMLAIKALLAKYEQLPTLMFDEIDTGVSGEISNKMGDIMKEMGKTMQVFSITHLPQVASKGMSQFKVFKEEQHDTTTTSMRLLTDEERVHELAEMLGGKQLSDSALAHARQLLG